MILSLFCSCFLLSCWWLLMDLWENNKLIRKEEDTRRFHIYTYKKKGGLVVLQEPFCVAAKTSGTLRPTAPHFRGAFSVRIEWLSSFLPGHWVTSSFSQCAYTPTSVHDSGNCNCQLFPFCPSVSPNRTNPHRKKRREGQSLLKIQTFLIVTLGYITVKTNVMLEGMKPLVVKRQCVLYVHYYYYIRTHAPHCKTSLTVSRKAVRGKCKRGSCSSPLTSTTLYSRAIFNYKVTKTNDTTWRCLHRRQCYRDQLTPVPPCWLCYNFLVRQKMFKLNSSWWKEKWLIRVNTEGRR